MMKLKRSRSGFTLVEITITIVIWGLLMIPLAYLVKQHIIGTAKVSDLASANDLARAELSIVAALSFTDPTLNDGYSHKTLGYDGYGYDLTRSVQNVTGAVGSLKKVTVTVLEPSTGNVITTLTTYISNIPFGVGSGGAAPVFAQANALIVQGGVRSGKTLSNVVLLNADTSKPIAVRQLTILFTGGGRLTKIVGNSVTLYSGNALSGSTVTLVTP